jgi:hypothetical protein
VPPSDRNFGTCNFLDFFFFFFFKGDTYKVHYQSQVYSRPFRMSIFSTMLVCRNVRFASFRAPELRADLLRAACRNFHKGPSEEGIGRQTLGHAHGS